MNLQEITKQISTRLHEAKALLNGFGAHGNGRRQPSEIEEVIRLHFEAEMLKFTTSVGELAVKIENHSDPRWVSLPSNLQGRR